MNVVVVTPRADTPLIGIVLVKKHLRVEHADDDDLIALYQSAVEGWLDGPAGWLGRALGPQTLRAEGLCAGADEALRLPFPPVSSVVSVSWIDGAGVERVIDAESYELVANRVCPTANEIWPTVGPMAVEFVTGPSTAILPRAIQAAMLLMIGDLYAFRETTVVGSISSSIQMSPAAEALLSPFRVWRV